MSAPVIRLGFTRLPDNYDIFAAVHRFRVQYPDTVVDVAQNGIVADSAEEKARFDVTFGGYTNWSNAKSAILSYSSPRSGVLALSNGLLIGLDASSMDICCPEMHELVDFMKGKVIGYTMMIAEGSNEEAAWHNQVPSGHSVSGKDYSQDWLAFPIGEN